MLLTHTVTFVIVKGLTHSKCHCHLKRIDTKSQRGSDPLPNDCLKSVPGFSTYASVFFVAQIGSLFVMCTCTHIHINRRSGKTERNMETKHEGTQL